MYLNILKIAIETARLRRMRCDATYGGRHKRDMQIVLKNRRDVKISVRYYGGYFKVN